MKQQDALWQWEVKSSNSTRASGSWPISLSSAGHAIPAEQAAQIAASTRAFRTARMKIMPFFLNATSSQSAKAQLPTGPRRSLNR
jgi:hypothetical protein